MKAMRRTSIPLATALALGCAGHVTRPVEPQVETSTIAVEDLPVLDPALTYEHDFARVDPDSILTALLRARIPVVRAWLPLDDRCADPRGARFTVELARPDDRILRLDFRLGTGRLACATTLRRFVVTG